MKMKRKKCIAQNLTGDRFIPEVPSEATPGVGNQFDDRRSKLEGGI